MELTHSVSSICQPHSQSSSIFLCSSTSELEKERTKLQAAQRKLLYIVKHIAFRIFGFLLILVDIIIVIVDLSNVPKESDRAKLGLDWVVLTLTIYFIFEVNLRLFAMGPREFVKQWYNIVDYAIVILSFIMSVVSFAITLEHVSEYAKLVIVGRLVRIAVFVRLFTERKQLEAGVRNLVSQNKRRYVKDGFDLDLTYVTESVIAMSFPSSGKMAMYRNPIKEVAKFLDKYHPDHYKVYNLCSEKTYDEGYFHNRVERFPFDDHNPPPLSEMFRFTNNVGNWLSVDHRNVVAIHCKGGKGRTGTMIAVWLIESGIFESTKECLGYFGSRRTDLELGSKYQGVETPSQNRYVNYYGYIKNVLKSQLISHRCLQLNRLEIFSIKSIGNGDGSDLTMEIQDANKHCILWSEFSCPNNKREVSYSQENNCLTVDFKDGPILKDDVKIIFHSSSENVPCTEKDVAFFFWFHVSFIEDLKY
ncbi:hypothetical protein CHUAL_009106 [Chamberlinius hualienensis]